MRFVDHHNVSVKSNVFHHGWPVNILCRYSRFKSVWLMIRSGRNPLNSSGQYRLMVDSQTAMRPDFGTMRTTRFRSFITKRSRSMSPMKVFPRPTPSHQKCTAILLRDP